MEAPQNTRFYFEVSFSNTSLMKNDVNDEVPNETPQILKYFSNWMLNWNGVLKSNNKPKGDHATHF